jgi:serine phosphatase RsbU (regulator of sigma subunit)
MNNLPASVAEQLRDLMFSERALAWLSIDCSLFLIGAGGDLANHGLVSLRLGEPVAEQAFFLEGLLPLTATRDFVPSMELTSGRATDLHFYSDHDTTWVILLDVTAERDAARLMQQKAYDMTLLQEREAQLNRRLEAANSALVVAHRQLEESRDEMREELRRKQQELDEARTLQLSLVPPPYQGVVAGCPLTVDTILEPAKEVGGDLVDHFFIKDDLLVVLLGDVSGKGAGAALFMARTHASFRSIAARPDASRLFCAPEQAARLVNDALAAGNSDCTFVTMLLATLDLKTQRLTYVRAGHVPPFLRRANGEVERLNVTGGLPLGLMEDAVHKSAAVTMNPGDELLIVTDGVTEAMDPVKGLFGEKRVTDLVTGPASGGGIELDRLMEQVRSFEAGSAQSDDIAAILLRIGKGVR